MDGGGGGAYPLGPEPGVTSSVAPCAFGFVPILGFELCALERVAAQARRRVRRVFGAIVADCWEV